MIKYLKKIFLNQTPSNTILLGRWKNESQNIKNIYANHDHCGDIICKNPKNIKKYIIEKNNKF